MLALLDWISIQGHAFLAGFGALAQLILDWISVHQAYAGLIIFLISCLESLALVGILIPGMALMLGIGTLVGVGVLPFWSTIIWAALGAIAGDGISFWLGRHFNQRLHHIWPLSRYPRLVPQGEQFFHKHGELSILIGRFIGPLRAIVPAVAGMMGMSASRFYLMNVLSAIAWAPVVIIPGAVFGASTQVASQVSWRLFLIVLLLLLLMWFFAWLFHRSLRLSVYLINKRHHIQARLIYFSGYMSLIILLISFPVIFLTEKSAEIPRDFDQNQWWESQWQALIRANPQYNIQFYGDLSLLQKMQLSEAWYQPEELQINNIVKWLAPNPIIYDLPLYVPASNNVSLRWSVAVHNDVDIDENNSSIFLISINIEKKDFEKGRCLGFGQLQRLNYNPRVFGLGIPEISLEKKISSTVVKKIKAIDGLDVAIKKHNNSDLLLIRSMETNNCATKKF